MEWLCEVGGYELRLVVNTYYTCDPCVFEEVEGIGTSEWVVVCSQEMLGNSNEFKNQLTPPSLAVWEIFVVANTCTLNVLAMLVFVL